MAGGIQLRSTISEAVSVPLSHAIGQVPSAQTQPAQAPIDWAAVEREEAQLARMVQGEPALAATPMASVSTAPGVVHHAPPYPQPPAEPQPMIAMEELNIPCGDGSFTMRYPRGMSPADVDLVLPLVTAFLRRKRGPRTRKAGKS